MSIQTLLASVLRLNLSSDNAFTICQGIKDFLASERIQSDQTYADTLALTLRAETAAQSDTAGASPTFAFIDFTGTQVDARPATFDNQVSGGSIYHNYASGRTLGGKVDIYGPYSGSACFVEASDSNSTTVIVSDEKYSIAGPLTLVNELRPGTNEGPVMSFSETGLDTGAVHILVYLNPVQTEGKRSFRIDIKAFGIQETINTAEVSEIVRNGEKCYDAILQREADNRFSFRSQGQLLGTTTNAFAGTLAGYWCASGNFQQASGTAEGIFRASVGFMQASRSVLYSGATYTVPTTRPTLS